MNHKRQVKSGMDIQMQNNLMNGKSFDNTERTTQQPSIDDIGIEINDDKINKHSFVGN